MYPVGDVAFSYLIAKILARRQPTFLEFAALTIGAVFPAVSNVALQQLSIFGINHFWSHSPLLLVPLATLGLLAYRASFAQRRVILFLTMGFASHLLSDFLFDFPLIYFSDSVDDIGGPWLYPWTPILIRYEEPGFNIQPWEWIFEGLFLTGIIWAWKRTDIAVYGVIVAIGTLLGLILGL